VEVVTQTSTATTVFGDAAAVNEVTTGDATSGAADATGGVGRTRGRVARGDLVDGGGVAEHRGGGRGLRDHFHVSYERECQGRATRAGGPPKPPAPVTLTVCMVVRAGSSSTYWSSNIGPPEWSVWWV